MLSAFWSSLFSAVVVFGLGTCGFLFRHKLKDILSPCCDPRLEFNGTRKKKIVLSKCGSLPPESEIKESVGREIQTIASKMPYPNLNAYDNPFLMVGDYGFSAKMRKDIIDCYISALKDYKYHNEIDNILLSRFKPINLDIINRGNKGSGKMKLHISIDKGGELIYKNDKLLKYKDKVFSEPNLKQSYSRNIIATPDFYLDSTEYEYFGENYTAEPIKNTEITKTIEDSILQTEAVALDPLYVDTTTPGEIVLKWRIIESSLGKNGNSGTLRIIVK